MTLRTPGRRRVAAGREEDTGATALITAILVLAIFAVAAIAVDLMNSVFRSAMVNATVQHAATAAAQQLPDRCAAFDTALAVLAQDGNEIIDDSEAVTGVLDVGNASQFDDGDLDNGEIDIIERDGDLTGSGVPRVADLRSAGTCELTPGDGTYQVRSSRHRSPSRSSSPRSLPTGPRTSRASGAPVPRRSARRCPSSRSRSSPSAPTRTRTPTRPTAAPARKRRRHREPGPRHGPRAGQLALRPRFRGDRAQHHRDTGGHLAHDQP